jgi:hypothetical protein
MYAYSISMFKYSKEKQKEQKKRIVLNTKNLIYLRILFCLNSVSNKRFCCIVISDCVYAKDDLRLLTYAYKRS